MFLVQENPSMSIASTPLSALNSLSLTGQPATPARLRVARRKPNPTQGRALESLGHAIEYLVDSRTFALEPIDMEAHRILKIASQAVFYECAEIVPLPEQISLWLRQHLRVS